MLSCKVSKFNKYNWQQERALVITQDNIYNFKLKSKDGLNCDPCRGEESDQDRFAGWPDEKPSQDVQGVCDPR